jgi:2-polyprenyl-3-methyl-5-hydroxy-6-metoxy-1,4-benzoquinol methylase
VEVRTHYDHHLARIYPWMSGDFETKCAEFRKFLSDHNISSGNATVAVDLGAGHGIQSVALAQQGFNVIAVDFSEQLLGELTSRSNGMNITTLCDDLRKVSTFANKPELIVCCGDTLAHLESKTEVEMLLVQISKSLKNGGKVILSFRDYSSPLTGTDRFIPVKSDERMILTCVLDFEKDFVNVTDVIHENQNGTWKQKVSAYRKVRLTLNNITEWLTSSGFDIRHMQEMNRMHYVIASRK